MEVVGLLMRESGTVLERRVLMAEKRASSTRRKGRYLFASSVMCVVLERVRDGWVPFWGWGLGPFRVSFGLGAVGSSSSLFAISVSEPLAASCWGASPFEVVDEVPLGVG